MNPVNELTEIDVVELATRLDGGAVVVDVREADEYVEGHVPSARLVPLSELAERVDEIPDDTTVLVVCKVGGRSARACEHLAATGRDVVNVAGGTVAWIDAGLPVVTGADAGAWEAR